MPHSTADKEADVVIVGAGWYGLAAARTYLRLEPGTDLMIVDSDSSVGGVWSKGRIYPNLVAQVKHGLFSYSDTPMPKEGATSHDLVTGYMIQNYLEKYAETHDLLRRIRFNTWIEKAERSVRGWRLTIKGSDIAINTKKLILATGVTSVPSVPEFKRGEQPVPLIHSRDLAASVTTLGSDDIQNTIVIGASKSAYDSVYLLLSMGKRVTWLIRPDGAGPMPIMPTEMLGMNTIAAGSTRLMSYLSPSIHNSTGALSAFFQRTFLGRWITGRWWDLVTYMSDRDAGFANGGTISALKPSVSDKSAFWCDSGLGLITLSDFWDTLRGGNLKIVRDNIDVIEKDCVLLRSGDSVPADFIVSATGWGDHFSMFDAETKAELGLPTYGKPIPGGKHTSDVTEFSWEKHDMAADKTVNEKLPFLVKGPSTTNSHPSRNQLQRRWRLYKRSIPLELAVKGDRSLAILGQIHTIQTPIVSEVQSFWSILYLIGDIDLPDKAAMTKEIAEWNAWTRKRYASCGQRYPYCLFDFLPYLDGLMKDAGVNSRRKSNMISELFSPYKPEDWNGFLEEYMAKRQPRKLASFSSDSE